ncbi:MAG: hypothetical protein E3K37_02650 [Candidatus Kuenenia sp.]|nr:hypothetical protein [Candidatus Kuenenia hertensis]
MVKGSDSKVFFELFKKPQEKNDVQTEELKQKTKTAEIPQPHGTGTTIPQKTKEKPQNLTTDQPSAPVPSEAEVKPEPSDPLKWIKNTSTEELSIEKTMEKKHFTPDQTTATPLPPRQIVTPPASVPLKDEVVLRKDEVVLRQETLIIGAIAATFLSIACFFVGHKVGYNKGVTNQAEEWLETIEPKTSQQSGIGQTKTAEVPKEKAGKEAPPNVEKKQGNEKLVIQDSAAIKDRWTLRVVSYKNTKSNVTRAKEIAGLLQESLGYKAFVVNTGRDLFVCVGEFDDWDSTNLKDAQQAVANFEYQNKKQFSGCYPVRIR